MRNSNVRKRARHRRRVLAVLRDILNDPSVMPNADCRDLIVNVNHVDFGKTVRDIYVDFFGFRKHPHDLGWEEYHERYMREAKERGEQTYIDLTDMAALPEWRRIIEAELQKRLGLLYTPRLHVVRNLGRVAEEPIDRHE